MAKMVFRKCGAKGGRAPEEKDLGKKSGISNRPIATTREEKRKEEGKNPLSPTQKEGKKSLP